MAFWAMPNVAQIGIPPQPVFGTFPNQIKTFEAVDPLRILDVLGRLCTPACVSVLKQPRLTLGNQSLIPGDMGNAR